METDIALALSRELNSKLRGWANYVTPAQRRAGEDVEILRARHELYAKAREANPRRWSGSTRDWTPVAAVKLNIEREAIVTKAVLEEENKTLNAAYVRRQLA